MIAVAPSSSRAPGLPPLDSEHAECNTLRDYYALCNIADVLQMADIFESFRDVCMKNYNLDPAWYNIAPGLAWDACLKWTGSTLELSQNHGMILMIKEGTRVGISSLMHIYPKANNKYMSDFDQKVASKFIKYLDANNLYEWAMCLPSPVRNFKWMNEHLLRTWRSKRCILEVDLEYPEELHDLHNDYLLAPESLTINKSQKLVTISDIRPIMLCIM
jgi:hypothetical protein